MPLEPSIQRPAQHPDVAERILVLSGPTGAHEPGRLAVRGDLAHIKLAGRCFVPHYAVPMLHRTKSGAVLLAQGRTHAEAIAVLEEGTVIEVLDIAGAWAWGQVADDGLVGYLALEAVEPIA